MRRWFTALIAVVCILSLSNLGLAAYPTTTTHSKLYPCTSVQASPYSCDPTGVTDIAAAIESIKANQSNIGTIYFPHGTYKLATNLTIPAGMEIVREAGSTIAISTGVTLTLNCKVRGPDTQFFSCSGTGSVSFGNGVVDFFKPELWGAGPAVESTSAVNAAIAAATPSKGTVLFSNWYLCNSTVNVPLGPNIVGVGMYACGINSTANAPAITGTGKISEQYFMNFGVTQASNTNVGSNLLIIDLQYGANFSLFANLHLTGLAAVTQDGFVIRGSHPTAGANTNQFSNTLLNIRTGTADTEIPGVAIKLYGTGTADTRCNNNRLLSCTPGGFATGFYIYGQNNLMQSPAFNSLCSTAGVYVDSDASGGCSMNVLDSPYFDALIVAGGTCVVINNETNSNFNRLLSIRNPLPQTFLNSDVTLSGTKSAYTVFSIDDVWYQAASPVGMTASVGTKIINTALGHVWLKTGTDATTGWTRHLRSWSGLVVVDPPNIPAGTEVSFDITPSTVPTISTVVTNLNAIALEDGLIFRRVYFDGSTIKCRLYNYTGGDINPASQNWRYLITEY